MSEESALQPVAVEPSRARLAALELQLAERERALAAMTTDLHRLQSRYLGAVGGFYAELIELERAIVEAEIRAGLRPAVEPPNPAAADEPADRDAASLGSDGCSNRAAPSSDLKAIFRNLAKSIHPDLALDEPARWRRHSLMAEANRAYAERDEDRLRLMLHAWERSADAVPSDDPDAEAERVRRRLAGIEDRLIVIGREFDDLHASAIGRLQQKIDDARRQGWDLFAEMVAEVKREVRRAKAKLASFSVPYGSA